MEGMEILFMRRTKAYLIAARRLEQETWWVAASIRLMEQPISQKIESV
jgi:hypothetical protein